MGQATSSSVMKFFCRADPRFHDERFPGKLAEEHFQLVDNPRYITVVGDDDEARLDKIFHSSYRRNPSKRFRGYVEVVPQGGQSAEPDRLLRRHIMSMPP